MPTQLVTMIQYYIGIFRNFRLFFYLFYFAIERERFEEEKQQERNLKRDEIGVASRRYWVCEVTMSGIKIWIFHVHATLAKRDDDISPEHRRHTG